VQLTASARYSDASEQDVTAKALWTSSSPGIARVSATGLLEALSPGDSDVIATLSGIAGTLRVRVSPRLVDVSGRVIEKFGEKPLAGATVTIADGPNAGRTTSTGADGRFVLSQLSSGSFNVVATAADFESEQEPVINEVPVTIALEPLLNRMHWEGVYLTAKYWLEDRQLMVRHTGPMRLAIHSDCAAGGSEDGPIQVVVRDASDNLMVAHLLTRSSPRDIESARVVPPGNYHLNVRISQTGMGGVPPECGYRIDFSYPR